MGKRGAQALSKNPNWKGGRTVASNGYVLVKHPAHPQADSRGYVYEHRIVAEEKLGRPLKPGEVVHHINKKKDDNRPENIEVHASSAEHNAHHRTTNFDLRQPGEPNSVVLCACGCGRSFKKFDSAGRPRVFVAGHNGNRNAKGQFESRHDG